MNKTIKIIFFTLLGIYVIFKILGFAGVIKTFTVSSISGEPNLPMGSRVITSNVVSPENGDLITFERNDTVTIVNRLCGQEHDKVEIKDGVLFINDKNADSKIRLIHRYKIPTKQYISNRIYSTIPLYILTPMEDGDSIYIFMNDDIAKQFHLQSSRIIAKKGATDDHIKKTYNQNWNKDNFGPITIPTGKAFVLGDNRDNSEDSRYTGLVDQSKISGTIIYKK